MPFQQPEQGDVPIARVTFIRRDGARLGAILQPGRNFPEQGSEGAQLVEQSLRRFCHGDADALLVLDAKFDVHFARI